MKEDLKKKTQCNKKERDDEENGDINNVNERYTQYSKRKNNLIVRVNNLKAQL
jgi:hypothetical protein